MLKKANRLAKSKDILTTLARGRTFFNPYYTVKFLSGAERKFTVVISTKVFKRANRRNRLKRIVREHLQKNMLMFKPGNYAVLVKPKAATLPESEQLKYFLEVLTKLK